jgi:ribosome-associated protein
LTASTEAISQEDPIPANLSQDTLNTIVTSLDNNKAEDITSINLAGKSSIADHLVIATGGSKRQVAALADYVIRALKASGLKSIMVEGLDQADWILIDAGDVIAHIFRPEVRSFYNLDKMWTADLSKEETVIN